MPVLIAIFNPFFSGQYSPLTTACVFFVAVTFQKNTQISNNMKAAQEINISIQNTRSQGRTTKIS